MQEEGYTAGPEREATLARAWRLREKASECRNLAASAQLRGSRESYHRLASSYDELAALLDPGGETAAERAQESAVAFDFEALLFADDDSLREDGGSAAEAGPPAAGGPAG
jgi:hypothetical protein